MTASPDSLVFVSGYADVGQPGIQAFAFNTATGTLDLVGSYSEIGSPSFLVVHPNGRWIYVASELGQQHDGSAGAVWALQFEREPWNMQLLNRQPSGGEFPCHLQFDASGRWVFVSNYGTGSVEVLPVGDDGALGDPSDFVQHRGSSINPQRQEGPHAHSTVLSPDNRFAIVADLGLDQLVMYAFDATNGTLSPHAQVATHAGGGPRHMAFHPNGHYLYVGNEIESTITTYAYDAATGTLRAQATHSTLPHDVAGNSIADVHVAPSGQRVYISNRGHNSIAVFDVDAEGQLTFHAAVPCGGAIPRNFALAPDMRWTLVANQYSNLVAALPIDADSLVPGAPVGQVPATGASCIQFVSSQV